MVVVGGKAVTAMRRRSKDGDFRANIHRGPLVMDVALVHGTLQVLDGRLPLAAVQVNEPLHVSAPRPDIGISSVFDHLPQSPVGRHGLAQIAGNDVYKHVGDQQPRLSKDLRRIVIREQVIQEVKGLRLPAHHLARQRVDDLGLGPGLLVRMGNPAQRLGDEFQRARSISQEKQAIPAAKSNLATQRFPARDVGNQCFDVICHRHCRLEPIMEQVNPDPGH